MCICVKKGEEDDSSCVRADGRAKLSQVQLQQTSRKRKAGEMVADEDDKFQGSKRVYPLLLILHGWDEYCQQFHKRLDSTWKEIYSSMADSRQTNDLYTTSLTRLDGLK